MNILSQLTWQNIRRNRTRSLAAFGGIFLAAAMFTILTTAVYSLWDYVRRGTEYETGDYFVSADYVDEAGLEEAKKDPLIKRLSDLKITGHFSQFEKLGPGSTCPLGAVDKDFFSDMSVPLREGRFPENSSEIIIPEQINLVCLQKGWKTWEVGDTVSPDLFDLREAKTVAEDGWDKQYRPERTWTREFRIVGITGNKTYSDDENDWGSYCILTLADGAEGDTLWHRLFLRTAPKDAAAVLAGHYGQKSFLNDDLLRVYGAGGIGQSTVIILVIILAALLIIAALSAVLIRSIFSVSVTERTREFGLLASIGTTPKQIRTLVRRETLFFLGAALPLGLAAGILGAGGLLARYRGTLMRQFTFGESVPLSVRPSPAALIAAALVCSVTVLLSVANPVRRAARIIPLEAIRQNRDVRIRRTKQRIGERIAHPLGVPGWVGSRYEKVSRNKSKAVTAALIFTLVLFLPAVYLAGLAEKQAGFYSADFDFELQSIGGRLDPAVVEQLRSEPEVSASVLYASRQYYALFPSADLPEDYKAVQAGTPWAKDYSAVFSAETVCLAYIEDAVLSSELKAEGIDPQPYVSEEALYAAAVPFTAGGFAVPDEAGNWRQVFYEGYGPDKMPEELLCLTLAIPYELDAQAEPGVPIGPPTYCSTDDGRFLLENMGKTWLLEFEAEGSSGTAVCTYRSYDKATGTAGETATTADISFLQLRPHERLVDPPDGCGSLNSITLVLPLSKLPEEESFSLGIHVRSLADYYSLLDKLKALTKDNLLVYSDNRESAVNSLGMAALIRGVATGFLVLISLLCGINVFYTLSTNIVLRRRDFGILRSLGFSRKDLVKMISAECMGSGVRALMYGVPLSLGLCFVLSRLTGRGSASVFQPPWSALLLGMGVILLLMVLSTMYGLRLLKQMTPIEAIREENI